MEDLQNTTALPVGPDDPLVASDVGHKIPPLPDSPALIDAPAPVLDVKDTSDDANTESENNTSNEDEYGNPKPKPKLYSEEEVNERINRAVRDRLSRGKEATRTDEPRTDRTERADTRPNEPDANWEEQLEGFIEKTVSKLTSRQQSEHVRQREAQTQAEFETKLQTGMGRFQDFYDVVSPQPISDAMTLATRGMNDPAAFLYAASKRMPDELTRISKIQDPYSQMVEMGKLEERMKVTRPTTAAPRPLNKHQDDGQPFVPKEKRELTIEELIAQSQARELAKRNRQK